MTTQTAQTVHSRKSRRLLPLLVLVPTLWLLTVFFLCRTSLSARIYNAVIVNMTKAWYQAVFSQLAPGTVLLDVGIGTAGALLENEHIIREKQLTVFGVDVQPIYVKAAQRAVVTRRIPNQVKVACHSIYDVQSIQQWLNDTQGLSFVDAVYFSGSFSLLPDPSGALNAAQQLLLPGGTIFITQTYTSSVSRLGKLLKPLIRHVTTIDFGTLVSNEQVLRVFEQCNLTVVSHETLQQESAFGLSPHAYLSILKINGDMASNDTCLEQ